MDTGVSLQKFFALFARAVHGAKNPKKWRGLSAVAGIPLRISSNDVVARTAGCPRVATPRSESEWSFPAALAADMRTGSPALCGSLRETVMVLHDTSLGEEGKPMLGYEEKAERLKLIDAGRLARSPDKLLESLAHAEQLDPLDVERIPALRSISTRCAAHILKAQNKVLYAEERAGARPSENQETQLRSKTFL